MKSRGCQDPLCSQSSWTHAWFVTFTLHRYLLLSTPFFPNLNVFFHYTRHVFDLRQMYTLHVL
jgi:hypothetical protein